MDVFILSTLLLNESLHRGDGRAKFGPDKEEI